MARSSTRRLVSAAINVVVLAGPLVIAAPSPAGAANGGVTVTSYATPPSTDARAITTGPDGALWFVDGFAAGGRIGRVTTRGAYTFFGNPRIDDPVGITTGPDGAIWFTNFGDDSIGRITTKGAVTSWTSPAIRQPGKITVGPDGALWFVNLGGNSIGRITTKGAVTSYTATTVSAPAGIAAGPDGALWFTNSVGNSIGRITTGGTITDYVAPGVIRDPGDITAGRDGALWFTNAGSIGRVTTTGSVTGFPVASRGSAYGPRQITTGPDGALWFANLGNVPGPGSIGRLTTSGVFLDYTDPAIVNPNWIVAGPDGALWFTNGGFGTDPAVRRIGTPPPVAPDLGIRRRSDGAEIFGGSSFNLHAVAPGGTWTFAMLVRNDGTTTGDLVVRSQSSVLPPFSVRYLYGYFDVTSIVEGTGLRFAAVAPGDVRQVAVVFAAEPGATSGTSAQVDLRADGIPPAGTAPPPSAALRLRVTVP